MQPASEVIIIGAGPAGLILSLLLARNKIKSVVLEKSLQPTDDTRAVFYNAASQFEFERAGILDQVKQRGFQINAASFRDLSGNRLFAMPGAGQISLIQKDLTEIIQEAVEEDKLTEILWGHEVVELGQDEESALVEVQTANGKSRFSAKYIVGCDGGSSAVRRTLFGKDAMKGFTWEKPLVTIDIQYDIHAHLTDADESNLFLDENDGWISFRTSKNDVNQWRVIYRDTEGLSQEEYKQRSEQRLKQLLPGQPDVADYKLIRLKAYQVHQRAVEQMRQGRFVLAGDAAHVCAPTGALGLNGAVADAGSLSDCLVAILQGKAKDSILDKYSEVRLQKFKTIVDPQSQGTMKMIFSNPESVVPNHPAYKFSQLLAADPEKAKTMGPDPLILRADFTDYMTL